MDDEDRRCTVCGNPVLYGSLHHTCGSALLDARRNRPSSEPIHADAKVGVSLNGLDGKLPFSLA